MMPTQNNHPDVLLTLTDRESLAVFRGLLEYRNLLRFSLLQGADDIIETELRSIDSVSEKISLATYFPERLFGEENA